MHSYTSYIVSILANAATSRQRYFMYSPTEQPAKKLQMKEQERLVETRTLGTARRLPRWQTIAALQLHRLVLFIPFLGEKITMEAKSSLTLG